MKFFRLAGPIVVLLAVASCGHVGPGGSVDVGAPVAPAGGTVPGTAVEAPTTTASPDTFASTLTARTGDTFSAVDPASRPTAISKDQAMKIAEGQVPDGDPTKTFVQLGQYGSASPTGTVPSGAPLTGTIPRKGATTLVWLVSFEGLVIPSASPHAPLGAHNTEQNVEIDAQTGAVLSVLTFR